MSISLCIITKNEEEYLQQCLKSVKGIVDEIIVVDTGSEDGTTSLAKKFGAKVYTFLWKDDFSGARNFSLEQARCDWILVLDADEELTLNSSQSIKKLINQTCQDAFRLRIRNMMPEGELEKYQDFYLTRLFKNKPEYRYSGCIHEQIRPSIERQRGQIGTSDIMIIHHGYSRLNVQGENRRTERNLELLQKVLAKEPNDPYWYYQIGATYQGMGKRIEAREALLKAIKQGKHTLTSPILEKIYAKLAQLEFARDNTTMAKMYAAKSLRYNANNLVALYILSLTLVFEYRFKEALKGFQRIKQNPTANLTAAKELDKIILYCRQQFVQTS